MSLRILTVLLVPSLGAGCVPLDVTAQAGYAHVQIDGDLALDDGQSSSQSSIQQGVDSAFGLGDGHGSPYLRAQVEAGGPVLTGSIFWLRDSGEGELNQSFGGLSANTRVASELDLAVGKVSLAYDFDLGVVRIAPGVMFDVFALDFTARELVLGSREEIDEVVFVPMPFVRAQADVGPVAAVAEFGYLDVAGLGDTDGTFYDVEAALEWTVAPMAHLFVGYRMIGIDGSGETDSERFSADLTIRGLTIGGGVRF